VRLGRRGKESGKTISWQLNVGGLLVRLQERGGVLKGKGEYPFV